jgi:hypothetical protein
MEKAAKSRNMLHFKGKRGEAETTRINSKKTFFIKLLSLGDSARGRNVAAGTGQRGENLCII